MKYTTLLLMGLGLIVLAGCAVGRGAAGEIVLGVELGTLAEGANEAFGAAINTFAPGMGTLVATTLAGVGGIGGIAKMMLNRAETRRRKADMKREAAEKIAVVLEAKLEAVNGGASA